MCCLKRHRSKSITFGQTRLQLSPRGRTDLRVHGGIAPITNEEVIFKAAANTSTRDQGATSSMTPTSCRSTPTLTPTKRFTSLGVTSANTSTTSAMPAIASRGGATHAMKRKTLAEGNMTPNGAISMRLSSRLPRLTLVMSSCPSLSTPLGWLSATSSIT